MEYPLHEAVVCGEPEDVSRLITEGVDVRKRGVYYETALHWVAARGELELAKLLIEAGAYATAADRFGESTASTAKRFNHPELSSFLQSECEKEYGEQPGFKERLERERRKRDHPLPEGPFG